MELKIDETAVQEVVRKAIMDQLGEEGRERLVAAALEHLLAPGARDSYNRGVSPLQTAFNQAVGVAAGEIVRDLVSTDPEFQQRLKVVVGEAMLSIDAESFSNFVGTALADALKSSGLRT